jgi:hypothetical protein
MIALAKRGEKGSEYESVKLSIETQLVQVPPCTLRTRQSPDGMATLATGLPATALTGHQALDELDGILFREPISCVLELDFSSYSDAIVRKLLMEMIERRISDSSILRLIGKWIHVGVIDEARLLSSETGIGQGQVSSPFLANVYLHHILDRWFEDKVKPCAVLGHEHARAWLGKMPVSDLKSFWGALGCACWAV